MSERKIEDGFSIRPETKLQPTPADMPASAVEQATFDGVLTEIAQLAKGFDTRLAMVNRQLDRVLDRRAA